MRVTVQIVVALVVVLAATGLMLRWRKVRRDHRRELHRSSDRRLLTPPPSPYATSKGFRLLDGEDAPLARPAPSRARLEADHDFIFSDLQAPLNDDAVGVTARRDELWALSRSAHRPKVHVTSWRLGVVVAVLLLILGLVGYEFVGVHSGSTSTTTSTTTTTIVTGAPGTVPPARFVIANLSAQSVTNPWSSATEELVGADVAVFESVPVGSTSLRIQARI